MGHLRGVGDGFGESEISDFEVELVVDHDVGRVEVAMDDFFVVVHVPEDGEEADEEFPDELFLEVLALFALVPDKLRQVGAFDDFHDDVKVAVLDEGLVELDDVGVFELFVDFDLSELLVYLLAGHLRDLQSF